MVLGWLGSQWNTSEQPPGDKKFDLHHHSINNTKRDETLERTMLHQL